MVVNYFDVDHHALLCFRYSQTRPCFFNLVVVQETDELGEAHQSIRHVTMIRNVLDEELVLHIAHRHVVAELFEAIILR